MKRFCVVMLVSLFSIGAFAGSIYKSYDEHGRPVYSDKRPKTEHEVVFSPSTKKRRQDDDNEEPVPMAKSRSMDSVREVTNANVGDINRIYDDLLKKDKTLQGKVTVDFIINKQGAVTSCGEDETAMTQAVFNGRICEVLKTLQYGLVESDNAMNVSFTFSFSPSTKK